MIKHGLELSRCRRQVPPVHVSIAPACPCRPTRSSCMWAFTRNTQQVASATHIGGGGRGHRRGGRGHRQPVAVAGLAVHSGQRNGGGGRADDSDGGPPRHLSPVGHLLGAPAESVHSSRLGGLLSLRSEDGGRRRRRGVVTTSGMVCRRLVCSAGASYRCSLPIPSLPAPCAHPVWGGPTCLCLCPNHIWPLTPRAQHAGGHEGHCTLPGLCQLTKIIIT